MTTNSSPRQPTAAELAAAHAQYDADLTAQRASDLAWLAEATRRYQPAGPGESVETPLERAQRDA